MASLLFFLQKPIDNRWKKLYYCTSEVIQLLFSGGVLMKWTLDKSKPLCPQICEQVCLKIALGEFTPGGKMFSVRETALLAGVNPNTVQKAFEVLEQDGILYSVRGSGWFVSEDIAKAKETLDNLVYEKTQAYFESLIALGMNSEQIKNYVKEWDYE